MVGMAHTVWGDLSFRQSLAIFNAFLFSAIISIFGFI